MAASLRRTLAVRFSLTMGVALLLIAVWAHQGLSRILRGQLDRALATSYELQASVVAAHGDIPTLRPGERGRSVEQINRMVVGRDAAGRITQANTGLATDFALDSSALRQALAGRRAFVTEVWRGRPVRALYGPAPANPGDIAVLEVAAFTEPIEAQSRNVLHRMIATALLGALASLVGAFWLTRSALAPVENIARQAGEIQGGRTGQRITVHADVIELRGLIDVLNQMLTRLEQTHEWRRQIIRDLGHDLRTPIATMRAAVEMALWTERRPEQYREVLRGTIDEIDRLTLITDALSLLTKLESGELHPALEATDLRTVASEAVARARERVGPHDIRFARPAEPLPALADRRLLGIMMDQLLDNARHHTPAGTPVHVSLAGRDGTVRVTVEDEGPGVPEEVLPQLFNRFYRGDPARGRHAGPGLGLSLAAAVVELHRGRITAERASPQGLRILIDLPGGHPADTGAPRPAPAAAS